MKMLVILIAFTSLNAFAYDLKDLQKEYGKSKGRSVASVLGMKEGKVKKIGDQHFIQYKGEVYGLVAYDEAKLRELAEKYKQMKKK